jgi:hypothetical protein
MTKLKHARVWAIVAALLVVGCASPTPSLSPVPSTSPITVSPPPTATPAPAVVCDDPPTRKTPLTCAKAVAAATAALGSTETVVSIEFHYGYLPCPPGARCAAPSPGTGYVVFRRPGTAGDLVVGVVADQAGTVSAGSAEPLATDPTG